MSDTPPNDDLPEWWKQLNPDEQAFFRRIMGKNWRPSRFSAFAASRPTIATLAPAWAKACAIAS